MSAVGAYAGRGAGSVPLTHRQPLLSSQPRQLDPERLGDHFDRLYRAAWALCGSREDAEDLVQETYAHVLRRPRLLRSDEDLGYLLRVMRNTHFSGHRASRRRPRTEPLPDQPDLIEDVVLRALIQLDEGFAVPGAGRFVNAGQPLAPGIPIVRHVLIADPVCDAVAATAVDPGSDGDALVLGAVVLWQDPIAYGLQGARLGGVEILDRGNVMDAVEDDRPRCLVPGPTCTGRRTASIFSEPVIRACLVPPVARFTVARRLLMALR